MTADEWTYEMEDGVPVAWHRKGQESEAKVHIEGAEVVVTAKENGWPPRMVVQRLLGALEKMGQPRPKENLTQRWQPA